MKIIILLALLSLSGCADYGMKVKACYPTKYGTICATADRDAIEVEMALRGLSKD